MSDDELPPMTADEDDDNDTPRRLSDDDEGSIDDEPGRSASPDGHPRHVKYEVPPVSLHATKVFERDADG